MVDTWRGILRVRKWPKKRPGPQTPQERFWVDWFSQANRLAKYADAASQIRAKELTKGTGLYPRDVLLAAMRGRLYTWIDETGWKWYSMAAVGDISESLDVLAQKIGSVLVRATDRWRAPPAGDVGDVLTYQGPADAPTWTPPAGGGGTSTEVIPGTPIVPDNTESEYILNVKPYMRVEIVLDLIAFAFSSRPYFRFSVDDGVTYKNGAPDYREIFLFSASSGTTLRDKIFTTNAIWPNDHLAKASFNNLRLDRATYAVTGARAGSSSGVRDGFARFDGPVTHIKVFSDPVANFTAGRIRAVGLR